MAGSPDRSLGISVVTIALNAAAQLPLTLESILAQDYPDLELIVVDGMSWDGTSRVLASYADHITKLNVEEDSGIYDAMNRSLELVSKDYVIFMNAGDQFFSRDAISRMVRGVRGTPGIFYGNHVYVDRKLELFKRSARFDLIAQRLTTGLIDGPWLESIPCHQATFTRTELLRGLQYDARLRVSADHELLFRAHDQGAEMLYVDEIVSHYFGGGYSAAMGERTKLEGASVYRRFSDRPDLVDRFFYPALSPFQPQTLRTGVKLGGFYASQTRPTAAGTLQVGEWVAAEGCQFLSSKRESGVLEISGFNEIPDQRADFYLQDELIGSASIPASSFRLEVAFDRPVPGGSTIALVPWRSRAISEEGGPTAAFAIRSFRFQPTGSAERALLTPGGIIQFREGQTADFMAALGGGWSPPEATHIWGVGEQSELWLKIDDSVSRLRFTVTGNPHVPSGHQPVAILVEGAIAATGVAEHGGGLVLEFDCAAAGWRRGAINRVTFKPEVIARPPAGTGDDRLLGICIWQLEAI